MPINSDKAFARLLGALNTHVLQRVERNPNKPINKSAHRREVQFVDEELRSNLAPEAQQFNYNWGMNGISDEAISDVPDFMNERIIWDDASVTDGSIDIGDPAALQNIFDGGGTVEFLLRVNANQGATDNFVLVVKGPWGLTLRAYSTVNDDWQLDFIYFASTTTGNWRTTVNPIEDNKVYRVAIVFNADTDTNEPEIYVFGSNEGPGADGPEHFELGSGLAYNPGFTFVGTRTTDVGSDLLFGDEVSGGSDDLDFELGDMRIWDDIRTYTELRDNAFIEINAASAGLIGYWKGDGSGLTVDDSHANNNDGTLTPATPPRAPSRTGSLRTIPDVQARYNWSGAWQ